MKTAIALVILTYIIGTPTYAGEIRKIFGKNGPITVGSPYKGVVNNGEIAGKSTTGLTVTGTAAGSVINNGTITGTTGISVSGSSSSTITNNGTISATSTSSSSSTATGISTSK